MNYFTIDDAELKNIINSQEVKSKDELLSIVEKAKSTKGISKQDVLHLLNSDDEDVWNNIFTIANDIKEKIYGDRIVLFAPLYISNYCKNNCVYCGFNDQKNFARRTLSQEQIIDELKVLEAMGHKRIALESGEDDVQAPIEYVLESIKTIYNYKLKNGEIRRINVNIAATTVENYKKLHEANIGTYILFQETYNQEAYEVNHISGPKSNYLYHLQVFDRAMQAGIEDVGAGVLFGLYDYKYEILALMQHNEYLEKTYGIGFHTISMPRLRNVGNNELIGDYLVDDENYKKIVAILRIAVPYCGLIISTRENVQMRKELIKLGVTQISAASSVEVYGYSNRNTYEKQFNLCDERSAENVIMWLMEEELIPSFCTACYRSGRVGHKFGDLAKTGAIKDICKPNAILTLKEYANDYGSPEFVEFTNKFIENKLNKLDPQLKEIMETKLAQIDAGQRDLFL